MQKVHFQADGAGCFKGNVAKAACIHWSKLVGIEEKTYKISVAGCGKSNLDGMFGRFSVVLSNAVDKGGSYYNMESIIDLVSESNGLSASQIVGFTPDRSNQLTVEIDNGWRDSYSISSSHFALV